MATCFDKSVVVAKTSSIALKKNTFSSSLSFDFSFQNLHSFTDILAQDNSSFLNTTSTDSSSPVVSLNTSVSPSVFLNKINEKEITFTKHNTSNINTKNDHHDDNEDVGHKQSQMDHFEKNKTTKPLKQLQQLKSIRLGCNEITSLKDMQDVMSKLFSKLSNILWIDLSFNKIEKIPYEVFKDFPALSTLYLHANHIQKYTDIHHISTLKQLRSLTLHGNPVEDKKHYRNYVLYKFSSLLQLDFSPITKQERVNAVSWSLIHRHWLHSNFKNQLHKDIPSH